MNISVRTRHLPFEVIAHLVEILKCVWHVHVAMYMAYVLLLSHNKHRRFYYTVDDDLLLTVQVS